MLLKLVQSKPQVVTSTDQLEIMTITDIEWNTHSIPMPASFCIVDNSIWSIDFPNAPGNKVSLPHSGVQLWQREIRNGVVGQRTKDFI